MYSKHKDELPERTVERIKRSYADKLGLFLECRIDRHVDGVYSAYLLDRAGKWNTAGKGTTEEYCMASAYGESMEHLCNHFAFDISKLPPEAREYGGFLRYADERRLPLRTIVRGCPSVWRDMTEGCAPAGGEKAGEDAILKVWERLLASDTTPFVPYYCVNTGETVMLPDAVISKLCGSNGGGSGNTPEEAIGHALDEIVERYAKYRIIYDELTPPTIPPEYIRNRCLELYELIDRIERSGELKVIVKDASLGKGYCVICILVIDEKKQRYLVNFGAHPCFEIALERCLTELFQDHKCVARLLDRNDMVEWRGVPSETVKGLKNWVSLLRDDIGCLPDSIFLSEASWSFEPWPEYDAYTNHFGATLQLELLRRNGFELYIRDNSFLGFPVYRVYVPGMSVSHLCFDEELVEAGELADRLGGILSDGASYAEKAALNRVAFHDNEFLIGMSLQSLRDEDAALLKAAVACDVGDREKALAVLRGCNGMAGSLLRRYLELKGRGFSEEQIRELIRLFFGGAAASGLEKIENGDAFAFAAGYLREKGLIRSREAAAGGSAHARELLHMRVKQAIGEWQSDQSAIKQAL